MNKKRALRFVKYLLMMLISLNFVTAIIVLTMNPGLPISLMVVALMTAISVIVASRDVGYIHWF